MEVGQKIKLVRLHRGLTQKQLGDLLNLGDGGANRIAQYEIGYRVPKPSLLKEIAKVLDVKEETFFVSDKYLLREWLTRKQELASHAITKSEYLEWLLQWPASSDMAGKREPKRQWRKAK